MSEHFLNYETASEAKHIRNFSNRDTIISNRRQFGMSVPHGESSLAVEQPSTAAFVISLPISQKSCPAIR